MCGEYTKISNCVADRKLLIIDGAEQHFLGLCDHGMVKSFSHNIQFIVHREIGMGSGVAIVVYHV